MGMEKSVDFSKGLNQGRGKLVMWVLVFGLASGLTACDSAKKSLGMGRSSPNEFGVVSRSPLTVPPEFRLRPPVTNPNLAASEALQSEAQTALFGTSEAKKSEAMMKNLSPSEQALLQGAKVNQFDAATKADLAAQVPDPVLQDAELTDSIRNLGNVPKADTKAEGAKKPVATKPATKVAAAAPVETSAASPTVGTTSRTPTAKPAVGAVASTPKTNAPKTNAPETKTVNPAAERPMQKPIDGGDIAKDLLGYLGVKNVVGSGAPSPSPSMENPAKPVRKQGWLGSIKEYVPLLGNNEGASVTRSDPLENIPDSSSLEVAETQGGVADKVRQRESNAASGIQVEESRNDSSGSGISARTSHSQGKKPSPNASRDQKSERLQDLSEDFAF